MGVGSDDVLALSFLTFFNSEKPILFPDITYSFYDVWADLFRIPYETKALDADFRIRKEDYYGENGGVIFPNPNAPTGILMPLADIRDILDHNQDVIVIVDEAYIDFGGETTLLPTTRICWWCRPLAIPLPALRIGYAIPPDPCSPRCEIFL